LGGEKPLTLCGGGTIPPRRTSDQSMATSRARKIKQPDRGGLCNSEVIKNVSGVLREMDFCPPRLPLTGALFKVSLTEGLHQIIGTRGFLASGKQTRQSFSRSNRGVDNQRNSTVSKGYKSQGRNGFIHPSKDSKTPRGGGLGGFAVKHPEDKLRKQGGGKKGNPASEALT